MLPSGASMPILTDSNLVSALRPASSVLFAALAQQSGVNPFAQMFARSTIGSKTWAISWRRANRLANSSDIQSDARPRFRGGSYDWGHNGVGQSGRGLPRSSTSSKRLRQARKGAAGAERPPVPAVTIPPMANGMIAKPTKSVSTASRCGVFRSQRHYAVRDFPSVKARCVPIPAATSVRISKKKRPSCRRLRSKIPLDT